MKQQPLVSIIIIAYNRPHTLSKLLQSIYKSSFKNTELIVVNNSEEIYKSQYEEIMQDYPSIGHIWCGKNLFISGAWNVGFKRAKGDLIFFCGDDYIFDKMMLSQLTKFILSNDDCGVVGPGVYYSNNEIFPPLFSISLSTGIPLAKKYNPGANLVHIVDGVIMIKRCLVNEISGFDEKNFNFYLESADLCARIRQKGYKCIILFEAKVWHDHLPRKGNMFTDPDRYKYSKTYYYLLSTKIKFIRKYADILQKISFFCLFLWLLIVWHGAIILLLSKQKKREKIIMLYKGAINGIFEKL